MNEYFSAAAYGGDGWSPRRRTLRQEIGSVWGPFAVDSEWTSLEAVLLHCPGDEVERVTDPDRAQMIQPLDLARARRQHAALADAFRDAGVRVWHVEPPEEALPNLMFVADLMFMTPEGAILGRPASTVRAGEERLIARRLADLGVPILRSVRGGGAFEGADAAWIDERTVMLATGLRTNAAGAEQVSSLLAELDVEVVHVGLSHGTMHLMGQLRFADRDLAVAWPGRVPHAAIEALRERGYEVIFLPDQEEASNGMALNFVTLGPRRILMAAGNSTTQAFYEDAGIECVTAEVDELAKAAGGIGCLTGILRRQPAD